MSKSKRIAEWIVIGLFIAIVASIASILIYRSVVNSDWYTEKQWKKSYEQMVEKVNEPVNIKYIEIELDDNKKDFQNIEDAPIELFDDIKIVSYEIVDDVERIFAIQRNNPQITVFFNDKTATTFYITEDNKIYWGELFEVECPSLVDWYNEVGRKNQ